MGMFDELTCKYPLPVEGANTLFYQTKDTPHQWCDAYEIREDGTLWHEDCDIEDKSDPNAEGLMRIVGMMTRVNKRWVRVPDFIGELRFYTTLSKKWPYSGWIEWSAYFENGRVVRMNLVKHEPASAPNNRITDTEK